jgi:hypothetical protein
MALLTSFSWDLVINKDAEGRESHLERPQMVQDVPGTNYKAV